MESSAELEENGNVNILLTPILLCLWVQRKWKPALKASNHEQIFTILEILASKLNPTL